MNNKNRKVTQTEIKNPMLLESEIETQLKKQGSHFVYFVDISNLSVEQNKGFSVGILFGIILQADYVKQVSRTISYVERMKQNKQIQHDKFHLTELKTDQLADKLATYLKEKGFEAYSQSEKNIENSGFYNKEYQSTPLPHKTIAGMAGLGWIGKHNLMVTKEYGSAISMCSVLCTIPAKTILNSPLDSLCGDCKVCTTICKTKALTGNDWSKEKSRDNLINVNNCTTCLQCMVQCPWTLKYAQRLP